jgi:hypothetical protein
VNLVNLGCDHRLKADPCLPGNGRARRCGCLAYRHNPARSPPESAAPPSAGLPAGNGLIQKPGPSRVEFAAAVFVSLGVDPHSEGVFARLVIVVVAGPVVAFPPEVHEPGQAVLPSCGVRSCPVVSVPLRNAPRATGLWNVHPCSPRGHGGSRPWAEIQAVISSRSYCSNNANVSIGLPIGHAL